MPRILREKVRVNDDALGWIGIGVVLVAAFILDRNGPPHRWHAAIVWTISTFFGLLVFGRRKRTSLLFWLFWIACLALHTFGMWLFFTKLLPRLILGTLYVIPVAVLEAILLTGIFYRLERMLSPQNPVQSRSEMRSIEKE